METLRWIGVLLILAMAVVLHRIKMYLGPENKARLKIDLAFAGAKRAGHLLDEKTWRQALKTNRSE